MHLQLPASVITSAPAASLAPALTWSQLKARFTAALQAEQHYDQTVAEPAWRGVDHGIPAPDHVDATITKLTDARCEAEEALVACPAPDFAAVLWKVTYARQRWEDFVDWPDQWWDAVTADLQRFAEA